MPKPNATALPSRLLSLDVSGTCVGWAVWDGTRLVKHGRYRTKGKEHGEKLHGFHDFLTSLLRSVDPDAVAVEEPYKGRNARTFGVLMQYCAVVLMAHWEVFFTEIPKEYRIAAHAVKKAMKVRKGRNHEDNKRIAVQWANANYGLSLKFKEGDRTKRVSQDDEADAIAVGYAFHVRASKR